MKPTPEQLNTIAGGLLAIDRSQMEDAARDVWELVAPLVLEAAAREAEAFYDGWRGIESDRVTARELADRIRSMK